MTPMGAWLSARGAADRIEREHVTTAVATERERKREIDTVWERKIEDVRAEGARNKAAIHGGSGENRTGIKSR